ncbi:MAG: [FeFe] hydrogenase H-cluster radical SAM maturase HydE [Bacteroidales bacterium]|nr:[FeFe] hydrogenase H-cluster radical SAM maturase HydE [Bacteroidales bacterium]
MIEKILNKNEFSKEDIIYLLNCKGNERALLFEKSSEVKSKFIGNKVYLRGLVEFSNICCKNCYYCGIRKDNENVKRYNISDSEILESVKFAYRNNYGSVVLQSGELQSNKFSARIENLLKEIKKISNNELGITLSCGEQSEETYRRWFNSGAHRYLLRIEASNKELYKKLHPENELHSWEKRVECLKLLKKLDYQTGTGVMIGLPFQTIENLAEDLLFMKNLDIAMCGMGPYLEHEETPLYKYSNLLDPKNERFEMTMKMISILRIMMPKINIAATTALQAIDKIGREKIIKIGANILMPNITPGKYRDDYDLYMNKPCTDDSADDCKNCLEARIKIAGAEIGYGEWGDSLHFKEKNIENL